MRIEGIVVVNDETNERQTIKLKEALGIVVTENDEEVLLANDNASLHLKLIKLLLSNN